MLLVPVLAPAEEEVFYQEVDLVVTRDVIVTVRKAPEGGRPPWDPAQAQASCRDEDNVAMIAYHLIDDVAEHFLDLPSAAGTGRRTGMRSPGWSRRMTASSGVVGAWAFIRMTAASRR